jgi:TolB-like protein/DNA-binding winged helix-turn-helix (wHTH) protein/Flp pilus assembly protein TadD
MATQPRVAERLRFDGFELDVRAGELRKHGIKVRLRGQPLQVLEILLERAGDVVTREELQARIWTADTFVDFDHSLHNSIARIREALGDSADTPRYIETLPRRGYRFIGTVDNFPALRLVPEPGDENGVGLAVVVATPAESTPARSTRAISNPHLVILLSVLGVLGLAGWAVWHHFSATNVPPIRSIAVLPLENFSGDPSQEYFVDGMTDELITDLAQIGALRVTSRTSVMRYKGTKKSLPEIARELNVDGIIEGSVTRSGQRVRITAQLLQGSTDKHIWAKTYDRDLGDVLKLQAELAEAIAQQVRAQLSPTQRAQVRQTHAVNPAAHDAYLRGRLTYVNEYTNPDSLKKAQRLFEESIHEDPNFALAYAGLADTYVYLAFAKALPRDQAYRSAREALAKALELDDSIGEAYDTLGVLSWQFDWDWDAADRNFNRALALSPSYSCTHEDRASFLGAMGRRAEALAEIAQIDQLDFGLSAAHTESGTYSQLGDYPDLIEASQRGLLFEPKDWFEHYALGTGYEGTGNLQQAVAEYQKAVEISQGDQNVLASLAHAYVAIGRRAEAEKILRDLVQKSKQAYVSPYVIATVYASLGDKDKAFEFLDRSYQARGFELPSSLKSDSRLDNLRSDNRFESLLRKVGLAH